MGFLLSAVSLSWKIPPTPLYQRGQGGFCTEGGQSPPVPVPIFMMQHLLSDDTGERARLAVRCGNPPILFLPPLKIDGSERDPRVSYSIEIALDPI